MPSAIERWHSQQRDLPVLIRALRAVLFDRYHQVPEVNEEGAPLKFYISPNDLVYVPNDEEKNSKEIDFCIDRIYKFVSASGPQAFFVRNNIASVIANKVELLSLNKMEKSMDGPMIKATCWKLEVDRLGNITKVIR